MITAVDEKIRTILQSRYSVRGYLELMQEIFAGMRVIAPDYPREERSNFTFYIQSYTHVGEYITPNNEKLSIFAVCLNKDQQVQNARSTQRSFAKKLIENSGADAAMIAFYAEGDSKWRISYVRLDYEMRIEKGRLKAVENITPARRYSYLVGEDEPCHTAVERFRRFITDDPNAAKPTLDDLEDIFSVEKVTNEFFALYCEKFHQLCDTLRSNPDFLAEAELHNFTVAQFAKKLMGQIVFLYFLQKKGWLGVNVWPREIRGRDLKKAYYGAGQLSRLKIPQIYVLRVGDQVFPGDPTDTVHFSSEAVYTRNSAAINALTAEEDIELSRRCAKGEPWGSGPKDFMRRLFDAAAKRGADFFDDYLEPLFYDALNVNRGELGYCPALHCRIPFLSGGLFEPLDGYDWRNNHFDIPNSVFSNADEKELDADGILDIFDRYNFTMSEDEPMEREVAIDPEMLGKVFENLLEVQDRKSKGAFYTPREIVHYMCQESLIAYLTRTMGVPEEDIRDFILYGDLMKDEDTVKSKREGNGGMFISERLFLVDQEGNIVVNRLTDMDEALRNIRVADPAVGSGAFPLGMLNEIVRARQNITAYLAISMSNYDKRFMYRNDRSPYRLKYETIRNCIFAADLEPSAVDIAQLRLWLSLVIDDEINPEARNSLDGHPNPSSLPNLECNILCGNSLVDVFEGHPLINQSRLIGTVHQFQQTVLFTDSFESLLPALIQAQDDLFRCDNTERKQQLKQRIADLRDEIIMTQFEGAQPDTLERYEASKLLASKPYVLWQLDFARVFREKGGFDVIIGNPPYIQLQKSIDDETGEKLGDQYEELGFESFTKTGDIYCLFYEKGLRLLHDGGVLSFITSNKWMRASYGEKLRALFAERTNPLALIDFAGQKIFESATVDVNILIFTKEPNAGKTEACIIKEKCTGYLSVYVRRHGILMALNHSNAWIIYSPVEAEIKRKIEAVGIPLREWGISINFGIKTGFNDAFIITTKQRDALIAEDPKSAELIRPILRGRDIQRFSYSFADLWLICTFPSRQYNIDDFPAIKKYLLSFGIERLEQTGKKHVVDGQEIKARKKTNNRWFETQDSISYWNDFSRQKIIWKRIGSKIRFSYDDTGILCLDSTCFATGGDVAYLVAVLNSMMGNYLLKESPKTGTGDLIISVQALEPIRIPRLSTEGQKPYQELLTRILERIAHGEEYEALEQELNIMVFDAYGLTEEERKYVLNYVSEAYR